jgi:hypothetical protein
MYEPIEEGHGLLSRPPRHGVGVLIKSDEVSSSGQPVWHLKVNDRRRSQDVKETARAQSDDCGYPSNRRGFSSDRDIPL